MRGLVLIFMVCAVNAYAFKWDDLWYNQQRQAYNAFQNHQYAQAYDMSKHDQWIAASAYRMQNYQEALQRFKQDNSINGLYNQANTNVWLSQYDEAISLYDKVLEQDPDHELAKYNKKIAEALKAQKSQSERKENTSSQSKQNEQTQSPSKGSEDKQNASTDQDKSKEKSQSSGNKTSEQEAKQGNNSEDASSSASDKSHSDKVEAQQKNQSQDKASTHQTDNRQDAEKALEALSKRMPEDPRRFIRLKLKYEYLQRRDKKI